MLPAGYVAEFEVCDLRGSELSKGDEPTPRLQRYGDYALPMLVLSV